MYRTWWFAHVGRLKWHCRQRNIGFLGQSGPSKAQQGLCVSCPYMDFLQQNDRVGVSGEGHSGISVHWGHSWVLGAPQKMNHPLPTPALWSPGLVLAKLLVASSFFCTGLPQPSLPFHFFNVDIDGIKVTIKIQTPRFSPCCMLNVFFLAFYILAYGNNFVLLSKIWINVWDHVWPPDTAVHSFPGTHRLHSWSFHCEAVSVFWLGF